MEAPASSGEIWPEGNENVQCKKCGAALSENGLFCPKCGEKVEAAREATLFSPRLLKTAALAVVGLCLFLGVVFALSRLVTEVGPLDELVDAVDKTLNASSFRCEIVCYCDGQYQDSYSADAAISTECGEATVIVRLDSGRAMVLCDGKLIEARGSYAYGEADISEALRRFFDVYNGLDLSDIDIADALDAADPTGRIYRALNAKMDVETLDKCVETVLECVNDENWMKNNADYSVEEKDGAKTHTFTLDGATMQRFLDILKPAFRNRDEYFEARETIESLNEEIQFEFTVKDGYLVFAAATLHNNRAERYVVTIRDIGSANIDMEQLACWRSSAE